MKLHPALAALLFTSSLHAVTLVRDGKPQAAIVVPDAFADVLRKSVVKSKSVPMSVMLAAEELAEHVEKMTGARLPIVTESARGDGMAARIYLGECDATKGIVADRPLLAEEFFIRCTKTALHITGGDATPQGMKTQGTLFGVYDLLERDLGVRWLFPGKLGTVIPKVTTLTLPVMERREQPRIAKRKVRNVAVSRESVFAPVLKEWGISVEAWKAAQGPEAGGPWFARQRLGARIEIEGGHSYAGWYAKYGTEHPGFFALQPDGTRVQQPDRERLCKSNPVLWDFIAARRIEELRADPGKLTISIAPNDGGKNVFCMCPACRALDPADAPKIIGNLALIDPATRKPFAEYPSLSDRTFTFFNEIAKRVRAQMPDRFLVAYAYSVYRTPPVRLKALEPNLIIGYVGLDLPAIEAWSKIAPQLIIRPNDLGPAVDLGLPRNHAAYLANAVKFSVEHHAIGFDFDNCHGNWSSHGLDYYVLCKALWNPDVDARAVIADYCRAAYGAGANAMLRYHEALEHISDGVRADDKLLPGANDAPRLLRYYTPEKLGELEASLREAQQAIGGADADALARIALAGDSVTYARLVTTLLEVAGKPKAASTPGYAAKLKAVEDFLKSKTLTPSLAPLHSWRYLRTALAYSQREED